jgi:hypothetical protein
MRTAHSVEASGSAGRDILHEDSLAGGVSNSAIPKTTYLRHIKFELETSVGTYKRVMRQKNPPNITTEDLPKIEI